MGFFRRRQEETLNERLLREAGLDRERSERLSEEEEPQPEDPSPGEPRPVDPLAGKYPADHSFGAYWTAVARPPEFDAVVTVHAPDIDGDLVEFATLPDGDVIVDVESGDADLAPLAEAVEQQLSTPYRAWGRREAGDLWAVGARSIDVRRFACKLGDELVLVSREGEPMLQADGVPTTAWLPELQRAGEPLGSDYVVEARRLDGDLWEVRASAL